MDEVRTFLKLVEDDSIMLVLTINFETDNRLAVRRIFEQVNQWLLEAKTEFVDEVLALVKTDSLSVDQILSFLTITYAAKNFLENRKAYYDRAWREISQRRGEDVTKQLLQNLV